MTDQALIPRSARRQLAGYRKRIHAQGEIIRAQRRALIWVKGKTDATRSIVDKALVEGCREP